MRVNSVDLGEALRRRLAEFHRPDLEAPGNYSVKLAHGSAGVGRRFHELYRDHQLLLRCESAAELTEAVVHHLTGRWARSRSDAVVVAGIAVSGPGGLALLPTPFPGGLLVQLDRLGRRVGLQVHPSEYHALTAPQRHEGLERPVDVVLMQDHGQDHGPSHDLMEVSRSVVNRDLVDTPGTLDLLAGLLGKTMRIEWSNPRELSTRITSALRASARGMGSTR